MKEIYENGEYFKNNPTWDTSDSAWKAGKIEYILNKNNIAFDTMADIGCGAGQILKNIAKNYPEKKFDGYEISPQAFEMANKIKMNNINFYLGDFFDKSSKNYDVALLVDVFEHVQDPSVFLEEIKKRTKYALFHIPLSANVLNILRNGFINEKKQWGHLHFYTKDTALELLSDTGYDIIDYTYTDFAFELSKSKQDLLYNQGRRILNIFDKDLSVRVFGGSSLLVLAQ